MKTQEEREAMIKGSILFSVMATLVLIIIPYMLLPHYTVTGSVLFWGIKWIFLAFLPYPAVCLVILNNRLQEGAHNPLLGSESSALKIHCRVMQNTLEQWVWFAMCTLALVTVLTREELKIIPILSFMFAIARLVYWKGYFMNGTLGRRYGVQMTFTINISLLFGTALFLLLR